jgi:IS5 family transposase
MAQRTNTQIDLADSLIARSTNLNQRLDHIIRLIDWKQFEEPLKSVFPSKTGRPAYSASMLFKALLLQSWYNLSDYALEETLDDRISFRRFIGLSLGEKSPDHSTLCRFRERLVELKIMDILFDILHKQMLDKGLIVKKGTLVDATFVESAVKRPDQGEDGKAGTSDRDKEAKWAMQGKKRCFGYKGHVGVDMTSGLIRKAKLTAANVYEGYVFQDMITGDEQWAIADKAYESQENYDFLNNLKVNSGMMFSARSCYPLQEKEKLFNLVMSKHRAAVERVFGTLKRSYGYWRVRYKGRQKNHSWFLILCMALKLCT